jgi:hypothetical protein
MLPDNARALVNQIVCYIPLILKIKQGMKQRRSGGTQKQQGSATDRSALLCDNACALTNQIICYIPLIF